MKKALALLLLLSACQGPAKPPRPTPGPTPTPSPGATCRLLGQDLEISRFESDPERRTAGEHLSALRGNRAYLCSWDRDRYLHFFSNDAFGTYDVAFLDAAGKVVELAALGGNDEVGIQSTKEARHALILSPGWARARGLAVGAVAVFDPGHPRPMPAIEINGHAVHVETSHLLWQRMRGLMHRPRMSADEGMLFCYPGEDFHSFWMRHTLLPLDIAHFRADGSLVNVCRMKTYANPATDEEPRAPSDEPVRYVLEVNYGWFDARKLIDADGKPAGKVVMKVPASILELAAKADP